MSKEDEEIEKEKATVLNHLVNAGFPAQNLAPWMSIVFDKTHWLMMANIKTIGDACKILDEIKNSPESRNHGVIWSIDQLAQCYIHNLNDMSPSVGGHARKEFVYIASSQRSGVAVEPKKRGFWDKVLHRNKEQLGAQPYNE